MVGSGSVTGLQSPGTRRPKSAILKAQFHRTSTPEPARIRLSGLWHMLLFWLGILLSSTKPCSTSQKEDVRPPLDDAIIISNTRSGALLWRRNAGSRRHLAAVRRGNGQWAGAPPLSPTGGHVMSYLTNSYQKPSCFSYVKSATIVPANTGNKKPTQEAVGHLSSIFYVMVRFQKGIKIPFLLLQRGLVAFSNKSILLFKPRWSFFSFGLWSVKTLYIRQLKARPSTELLHFLLWGKWLDITLPSTYRPNILWCIASEATTLIPQR